MPQKSGSLARGEVGLDRENSMVLDLAERFWAATFAFFQAGPNDAKVAIVELAWRAARRGFKLPKSEMWTFVQYRRFGGQKQA
jgi:hypothetical protein